MSEEPNISGDQELEVAVPPSTETNQVQQEQPESNEAQQEQNVPLSALQSERTKRQETENELQMMKEHLALTKAYQSQPEQNQKKDDFDGLEDGDVMTVGEFKKLSGNMANKFSMTIEELKMAQKHPDYQEVITKYLPDILKTNPGLQNTLKSSQDYELAYYLAKNSDNYKSENKSRKKSADAQRIVENSQKAGSLSSLGSTSAISQAKRYKDMSDSDFMMEVNKNLG